MKSTTTVYGASNRDPAMFTEDMEPRRAPGSGYAKDVAEIEGYVRGFARRRPDVRVTMLRCANVIGAHVVSPITSYFRLPVIPTVLGFDARLQFLHEQRPAWTCCGTRSAPSVPGTFNVAGDGVLMLSQALRRLQRPTVPMPGFAVGQRRLVPAPARLADFSPEQLGFLTYGRGVDTTRMREELGFEPVVDDRGGVRRLRRGADARPAAGPSACSAAVADQLPSTAGAPRRPSGGGLDG